RGSYGQAVPVVDHPHPAAAEAGDRGGAQSPLQLRYRGESRLDRSGEGSVRTRSAIGRHGLPEEGVVRVTTAVVTDGGALFLRKAIEVAQQLLDRAVGPLGAVERRVEVFDVAPMVLVVMDAHG